MDGKDVVLHGLGTTSTEYLLRGIGMKSWVTYSWNDPSNIITSIKTDEVAAISSILAEAKSDSTVPAVRIPLCASSWLGVETTASKANMAKYPNLGNQYQTLVGKLVDAYTQAGIVSILDLHWNDDDTEQQAMALRGSTHLSGGATGDALAFWDSVAKIHGSNKMVFYELYNEPHIDAATWMNGNSQYVGMVEMAAAVRAHTADSVLVVAAAGDYAYDGDSHVQLWGQVAGNSNLTNVIANFHPYMGAAQSGDAQKCPSGFESIIQTIASKTQFPSMITEFGQACCPTGQGACYSCASSDLGYDDQILAICEKYSVSWLPWAWRPGAGPDSGSACQDLNGGNANGTALAGPVMKDGQQTGADFAGLWKKYNA